MYTGIVTLKDNTTPNGWNIESDNDIILALEAYPYFQTVAAPFIAEAVEQSAGDQTEYDDIKALAQHIAENYI